MTMKRLGVAALASGALLLAFSAPGLAGQAPAPPVTADQAMGPAGMAAKDHAMMADHEKMMADMKVADQRLDTLITRMNAAKGRAQPAATAAAVTEIVAQSRMMRETMMKAQMGMMSHVIQHMHAGDASMAACPMMAPMAGIKP